jgi:hypothetical protein
VASKIKELLILFFFFFSGAVDESHISCKNQFPDSSGRKPIMVLESISFNHNFDCCLDSDSSDLQHIDDALDIRMNFYDEVRIPEWKKGLKPYPAAYCIDKPICIRVCFSITSGIKKALIWAEKIGGSELGNLEKKEVSFNSNGKSNAVCFRVIGNTPKGITKFDQVWNWYWQPPSEKDIEKNSFAVSKNRIFIVLERPQYPWYETRNSMPWAYVLEKACSWAEGEIEPVGAATKITNYMHNNIIGIYDRGSCYTYSGISFVFNLEKFLKRLPFVGKVNCVDLAQALVIFSNSVGCGSIYNYRGLNQYMDNNLNCIRAFGEEKFKCDREKPFKYHAFATVEGGVFDASFKLDEDCDPGSSPHCETLVTNMPMTKYKTALAKNNIWPKVCLKKQKFQIGARKEIKECGSDFERRLNLASEEMGIQLNINEPGIQKAIEKGVLEQSLTDENLTQLNYVKNMLEANLYSREKILGVEYFVINQFRAKGYRQFQLTVVIGPNLEEIKKYLLYRYADFSITPAFIKRLKGIENICFIMGEKEEYPTNMDFIHGNILIMIRADGIAKAELYDMAKKMDAGIDFLLSK